MKAIESTRRDLMKGAGIAAIGWTIIKPGSVYGTPANSKLKVGLLGTGRRGSRISQYFVENPNSEVTALADIYDDHIARAQAYVTVDGASVEAAIAAQQRRADRVKLRMQDTIAEGVLIIATEGERVPYGILANRNAAASSEGETTGSWSRDVLRGLATLAAIEPSQAALGTDFTDLMATVRDGLRSAVDALEEERGALGATEQRLEATSARHAEVTVALKTQLAGIEEVDMAATISRLQAKGEMQLERTLNRAMSRAMPFDRPTMPILAAA